MVVPGGGKPQACAFNGLTRRTAPKWGIEPKGEFGAVTNRPDDASPQKSETPAALAGATGATVESGEARPLCAIAEASRQAFRAAKLMAPPLAILPPETARIIVDAMLAAVDDVRAADGLDVLGYGDRPTRAELRASYKALSPEKPRRGWRVAA
jgi:hypothetical protein